ncbi:MAG TPA: amino acid-binding protein [Actinomycetota bacterium]|nr:amino acid-binding protein [Actinomycetota bacterium]
MATDLSISLPDQPGGLANAAKALGAAGVNIEGLAGLGGGGTGHIHLLVEDAAAARSALQGAGVTIEGEREAVVVDVEDRPGALGELAAKVADAGVNLAACYAASRTRIVFSSDDAAALRSALGA